MSNGISQQLYVKENNMLQLALFYFGKPRPIPKETKFEWIDNDGKSHRLKCICQYGVPGSFEQDVYTATMRIWVKQGMPLDGVTLNYSDIARELGLNPNFWASKIKASLMKLGQARYEFTQCFIMADRSKQEDIIYFSLYDTAQLFEHSKGRSKRQSKSKLVFSKQIQMNLEARYYQRLDFSWYKALPGGLPRRLYEYLEKRRYHGVNGLFSIGEQWVCLWLPIHDQNATHRRALLERSAGELIRSGYLKKYEFDADRKLCRFTYAKPGPPPEDIEALDVQGRVAGALTYAPVQTPPKTTQRAPSVTWGEVLAVQEWLESIPYMHKRKIKAIASLPVDQVTAVYPAIRAEYERRIDEGKAPGPAWIYEEFHKQTDTPEPPPRNKPVEHPILFDFESNTEEESENDPTDDLQKLCALVSKNKCPHIPKTLETAIKKSLDDQGAAYVSGCIEYANRHSRKNYPKYLKDTLNGDYACDLIETKRADQLQEAEERRAQQEKQNNEVPRFLSAIANIPESERRSMWEQAEQKAGPQARSMQKAIEYKTIVLEHLAGNGEIFDKSVVSALDVARDIAGEFIEL